MGSVHHDVFSKIKVKKVLNRQEGDGREVQVDVREDEEQSIKLQEIIDLLVAAGYFRARIKGLSSFDKVVGGMTWCIESCNVDVDVDLLFQENSTIGQKIALTEKIVAVLPKLDCPHRIEPHQIQGLDFIHIYPVIQWLVKRSMEFRQEMSSFVRAYAVNQFCKDFPQDVNKNAQEQVLNNVKKVCEVYRPQRFYRRKNAPPSDLNSRVQVTLLEYGLKGELQRSKSVDDDTSNSSVVEEDRMDEHVIAQLLSTMTYANEDVETIKLNTDDQKLLQKHYESLFSELEDGGIKSKEEKQITLLTRQREYLENKYPVLLEEKQNLINLLEESSASLKEMSNQVTLAVKTLTDLESTGSKSPETIKEVEDLVVVNDGLRSQELLFRDHCKQELVRLQNRIEEVKSAKPVHINTEQINKDMETNQERIKVLRLQLAKKNRSIAALQRQLDDIPSRAELAQYQRRFLELYNQVATKHKETKQYYTLFNSLEDTRLYLQKELTLLNSISENYPEALMSHSSKEEFLKQLENILEGVKLSKRKVDARLASEKQRRDELSQTLQSFIEQQRKYVAAVRQLGIECRRHESLLTQ